MIKERDLKSNHIIDDRATEAESPSKCRIKTNRKKK